MSAFDKEKVFVELRKYHLEELPKVLTSPESSGFLEEYKNLEEQIVSMIFGLVNGKAEYIELGPKLTEFMNKTSTLSVADQKTLKSKAEHLLEVIQVAKSGDFHLRPQRKPKIIRSTNPRQIIEN